MSEFSEEDLKAAEAVKGRLKFFFSDANVRQDFFIRKHLINDKGEFPHMLTVESLLRFNTIKEYTTKPEVVVKAAKDLSDILKLNEKENAIGRVVPFTKDMMDGHIPKSLLLKNIPLKKKEGDEDLMQYAVTIDEVRAPFEKYGEVALVKFKWSASPDGEDKDNHDRRAKKKYPKGCAFVEFSSKEDLEKAAEATLTTKDGEDLEPKDKIVVGESEIQVRLLSEIKKPYDKNARNKKPHDKKRKEMDEEPEEDTEVKEFTFDWHPGCVIKIKGVPDSCDREALLEMLAKGLNTDVDGVKEKKIYVDYSRGEKNAAIRFPVQGDHIPDICKKLAGGELEIKGSKVEEARLCEGDEEKKYWEDFIAFKNKQLQQRAEEKRSKKKRRRH